MKQYISLENPLCGIDTYKDTLNLDTGATVRQIKKLVLTGQENWETVSSGSNTYSRLVIGSLNTYIADIILCSHCLYTDISTATPDYGCDIINSVGNARDFLAFRLQDYQYSANLKAFLADQYAVGMPVTVWYVLATPTTSTTTLPRGLSGIVEGSLTQSGTPTQTNPIYPTANSINSFLDKKYLKYGTETDIITTLPKTIIGDGTAISSYTIKGNMSQSGTPTPSNPIYPSETGDKTANLFDNNATDTTKGYVSGEYLIYTGSTSQNSLYRISEYIPISPNTSYTLVYGGIYNAPSICFYDANYNYIIGYAYNNRNVVTETAPIDAAFCRLSYTKSNIGVVMFNTGSTSLPYEPYGYKIPISCGGDTVTAYTSEPIREINSYADSKTETTETRQLKKIVLDGTESFYSLYDTPWNDSLLISNSGVITGITSNNPTPIICSHVPRVTLDTLYAQAATKNCCAIQRYGNIIFNLIGITTVEDYKTYLQQQYAAGTPVTFWFAVNAPTTTAVTMPTIPTTDTAETFDVDTTLKPSEVSLTYHGWHEHQDTVFTE